MLQCTKSWDSIVSTTAMMKEQDAVVSSSLLETPALGFQQFLCRHRVFLSTAQVTEESEAHDDGASTSEETARLDRSETTPADETDENLEVVGPRGRKRAAEDGKRRFDASGLHLFDSSPKKPRKREHTNTDGREYACTFCDASFCRKPDLKRHVNAVHMGLRPHPCDICGKSFSTSGNMRKHMRKLH
mmetsp:Transcript_7955/g.21077  ORF Transcript_7955/g.21077 Transcript_7955/m.21077 type:complete len:188 (+) Transcript_7955:95-658(+)